DAELRLGARQIVDAHLSARGVVLDAAEDDAAEAVDRAHRRDARGDRESRALDARHLVAAARTESTGGEGGEQSPFPLQSIGLQHAILSVLNVIRADAESNDLGVAVFRLMRRQPGVGAFEKRLTFALEI